MQTSLFFSYEVAINSKPGYYYRIMNFIGTQFVATGTVRTPSIKSVSGDLLLSTWGSSTFNMLKFGGTSAAYPAIKRSGTTLSFRKANDSAYANIEVGNLTVHGTLTGGSTLPSQTGHIGHVLTTDGSTASWTGAPAFSADNSFALDVSGTGLNTTYGRQQLRVSSSSSEAGIYFKNQGTGGRNYVMFVTSSASSLGGGKLVIADANSAAQRISINSSGDITLHTSAGNPSWVFTAGGTLYPATNDTFTFGDSSHRPSTTYLKSVDVLGTVTASYFSGNGSLLTNVNITPSIYDIGASTNNIISDFDNGRLQKTVVNANNTTLQAPTNGVEGDELELWIVTQIGYPCTLSVDSMIFLAEDDSRFPISLTADKRYIAILKKMNYGWELRQFLGGFYVDHLS